MKFRCSSIPPMDLRTFLKKAKTLRRSAAKNAQKSNEQRLELMLLLLDVERQRAIWQGEYETWDDLLRAEKLASPTHFLLFKSAVKNFGAKGVSTIGVSAAIAASQTGKHKQVIFDETAARAKEGATFQALSKFVRRRHRELSPQPTRGALVNYVSVLRQKLLDLGIKPPPMT